MNTVAEWIWSVSAESFFTISVFPICNNFLDLVEIFCIDDSLMGVGDVVGRNRSLALYLLLSDEIWRVDLWNYDKYVL